MSGCVQALVIMALLVSTTAATVALQMVEVQPYSLCHPQASAVAISSTHQMHATWHSSDVRCSPHVLSDLVPLTKLRPCLACVTAEASKTCLQRLPGQSRIFSIVLDYSQVFYMNTYSNVQTRVEPYKAF